MKQKDDVVYIHGVRPDWRFFKPLNIGQNNALSITLALQKDQAIALLLKKQNLVGSLVNTTKEQVEIKNEFSFGSVTNALG